MEKIRVFSGNIFYLEYYEKEAKCDHLMIKKNTNGYRGCGNDVYYAHIAKCSKCNKFYRSDYVFRWEEDHSDPYLCQNDTPTLYYKETTPAYIIYSLFYIYKEAELVKQWVNEFNDNVLKEEFVKYIKAKDWEKDTINGWIMNKMIGRDLIREEFFYLYDNHSKQIQNNFLYQGKEIGVGAIGYGFDGSMHREGDVSYRHIAPLGQVFQFHEFYEAIKLVEKERGVKIEIGDTMRLSQVLEVISRKDDLFELVYILKNKGLYDLNVIAQYIYDVSQELEKLLDNDFEVICNNVSWQLILSPKSLEAKNKIINREPELMQKLQSVYEYWDKTIQIILKNVEKAVENQSPEEKSKWGDRWQLIDFMQTQEK